MSTIAGKVKSLVVNVVVTEATLAVWLADGREIIVPIDWFPRLKNAATDEVTLGKWRVIDGDLRIRWERLDLNISVMDLLSLG